MAALPENAEIKASTENLAAVADRQEKSIVTMTEQVTAMDTAMATAKTEMEAAAKAGCRQRIDEEFRKDNADSDGGGSGH